MTDPDRWEILQELFSRACELPPSERPGFVQDQCGDDEELRAKLLGLLEAHDRAGLEAPDGEGPTRVPTPGLSGVTIGDYRVLEPIGEGGMGRVYRAFDVRLERYVALKTLPEELARDERWVARFKREARVLASVSHANIAAIYDVATHEDRPVLVLELVDGETLADLIARGPLPADRAVSIAWHVAAALEAAHSAGIVHRDLKPANIAVARDGSVKVLDFGIAKRPLRPATPGQITPTDELAVTDPGQTMGTVAYMSPEQIRGRQVDPRSDVWSFGIVLFEMLSATRPFAAESTADLLVRVLEHPPGWEALPRGVPRHLRVLLERCLEKDARQRLQAIGEARLLLESTASHPVTPRPHPSGSRRRALWVAPFLGVAALLLFAILRLGAGGPVEEGPGSRAWSPRQVSFTGDVIEAMIAPVGPYLAALRQVREEKVLTVFDLGGGDPVDIARGREICCLSWTPDGTRIAFQRQSADLRPSVHVVPAVGGLERAFAGDVAWLVGLRWSPDGSALATWAYNLGIVQAVDATSGEMRWYTPQGVADGIRYVLDIDWGPTGQFAMVIESEAGGYQVHVVESDGDELGPVDHPAGVGATRVAVASTLLASHDRPLDGVRWTPEGEAVYYMREDGQTRSLFRVGLPPDGGPQLIREGIHVVEDRRDRINLAVSRDDVLSFPGGQQYANLWHVPFDGSEPRALTTGTMTIRRPVTSPRGDRIAFEAATDAGYDIHVLDLGDGEIRKITAMRADAVSPTWSPSGDSIAFVSAEGGQHRVWLVHADGAAPAAFDVGQVADDLWRTLEWAPGSELLAQSPDLQYGRFTGQEPGRPLTTAPDSETNYVLGARYSPDGRSVAVYWNRAGDRAVWVVEEGRAPRRLLEGDRYPIGWSPDGSTIFAYGQRDRRVTAIDVTTGRLQMVLQLPFQVDEIDVDLAPDGRGVIAAVREAPGDAIVVDLSGS